MGMKGTDVARVGPLVYWMIILCHCLRHSSEEEFLTIFKSRFLIFLLFVPVIGLVYCQVFYSSFAYFIDADAYCFMELIIDPVCSIAFESEIRRKEAL